jgi:DNA-binding winged helix-turn-helix (wHTH) protein
MNSCLLQDSPTTAARYVRFGPFHIDQQRQRFFRNGTPLHLQGKVYQVLIVLLQREGEVVTREELRQALWPADTHVDYEANTNTAVNKLRRALGESTNKLPHIETIPRRGYRFTGTAEFSDTPFPGTNPANFTASDTMDSGGSHEPGKGDTPRLSKSPAMIGGALIVGMLVGATAATYWISHFPWR